MMTNRTSLELLLRPYRKQVFFLSVLAVLSAIIQVLFALVSRDVVDCAVKGGEGLLKWGILLVALILVLVLLSSFPMYAVQSRLIRAIPEISFCGTEADCAVTILGERVNDLITATMQLKRGNTVIDSWSGSDYYRLNLAGTADVKIGYTYDLHIDYSVNGVQKPPIVISKTND